VPGVVDTIGLAFGVLNRRPYLIWPVLLADSLIWLGGSLTARSWAGDWTRSDLVNWAPDPIELSNVVTALVPTLLDTIAVRSADVAQLYGSEQEVSGWTGGLLFAGTVIVSIVLAIVHLIIVSRLVRNEPIEVSDLIVLPLAATLRCIASLILVAGLVLLLMLPFFGISLGLEFSGVSSATLLFWAALLLSGWMGSFFIFTGVDLARGESKILVAMKRSYQTVLRNFAGLLGLLLIIMFIRLGLPFALTAFVESNWTVPFAVVVNGYIATGLTAAFVLFFQIRSQLLDPDSISGSPAD
jgi:hypothetical protein